MTEISKYDDIIDSRDGGQQDYTAVDFDGITYWVR